jgi:hypothetical protein
VRAGTDPQAQAPLPLDSPPAQVQIAATPCRPKQLQGTGPDGNAPTGGAAELLVPPPARCIWLLRPQVPSPAAEQAESSSQSGNAGSAPTLSTQISLPNYQPVNSNHDVQQMTSRKRRGSAGDRWNYDGSGGPDVEEALRSSTTPSTHMLNNFFRARERRAGQTARALSVSRVRARARARTKREVNTTRSD